MRSVLILSKSEWSLYLVSQDHYHHHDHQQDWMQCQFKEQFYIVCAMFFITSRSNSALIWFVHFIQSSTKELSIIVIPTKHLILKQYNCLNRIILGFFLQIIWIERGKIYIKLTFFQNFLAYRYQFNDWPLENHIDQFLFNTL